MVVSSTGSEVSATMMVNLLPMLPLPTVFEKDKTGFPPGAKTPVNAVPGIAAIAG